MKAFETIFFKQKNTNENVINPNSEYENIDIIWEQEIILKVGRHGKNKKL